jgi:hypothetical protein
MPSEKKLTLATAAAIELVNADCMMANRKCA